jgi:hypothetical protein
MAKTPKRPGWRGGPPRPPSGGRGGPPRPPSGGRSGGTGGGDKPRGGGGGSHDDRDARDDGEMIRLLTEINGKLGGGDRAAPGPQPTPPQGPAAGAPVEPTPPKGLPDLVREIAGGLKLSLGESVRGIVQSSGFGAPPRRPRRPRRRPRRYGRSGSQARWGSSPPRRPRPRRHRPRPGTAGSWTCSVAASPSYGLRGSRRCPR